MKKFLVSIIFINDSKKLKYFWVQIEAAYSPVSYKRLLGQEVYGKSFNILHFAARCKDIEIHVTLWKLLLKTFENREELKAFILQKDSLECDYLQMLVIENQKYIIKLVFEIIAENFSDIQNDEILRSEGYFNHNLLQTAARQSKDVEMHQILWTIFRRSCKTDKEFFEILLKKDLDGNHTLLTAAASTSGEVFEFMINELDKLLPNDKIREILFLSPLKSNNFLLLANQVNKSSDLHTSLWTIIRKYFVLIDILDMIMNTRWNCRNILLCAIEHNEQDIVNITWNEINKTFRDSCALDEEFLGILDDCHMYVLSLQEDFTRDHVKNMLNYNFSEIIKHLKADECRKMLQNNLNNGKLFTDYEFLNRLASCDRIDVHESFWMLDFSNSKDELKTLIMHKDFASNNFIHNLVFYDNLEIIKLTFDKFYQIFNKNQFDEILKSRGFSGRTVLQIAACDVKNVDTHKFLWKALKDICESNHEFLKFLKNNDDEDGNIFHHAAALSTSEIFQFIINEVSKIASHAVIKDLLCPLSKQNQNLLQMAQIQNKCVKHHETLWNVIEKYFNEAEIIDMIKNTDTCGSNPLIEHAEYNTREVVDLTWMKVKKLLISDEYFEEHLSKHWDKFYESFLLFLEHSGNKITKDVARGKWSKFIKKFNDIYPFKPVRKVLSQAIVSSEVDWIRIGYHKDMQFHEDLWNLLLHENLKDLTDLLLEKDVDGNNFIHCILAHNTDDIIKFTFAKIVENFNDDQQKQIFESRGILDRNLLQRAASCIQSIEIHKILWNLTRKHSNIVDVINHLDYHGFHLLLIAAENNIKEIIKLTWIEIKSSYDLELKDFVNSNKENIAQVLIKSRNKFEFLEILLDLQDDIKPLLMQGDENENKFIHCLVVHCELQEIRFVVNKLKEKFNNSDFKEFITSKGHNGWDILQMSIRLSKNIKIFEFLWQIIQNYNNFKNVDNCGMNLVHLAVAFGNTEILNFLTLNLPQNQIKLLLSAVNQNRSNILQVLAKNNFPKLHECLWRIIRHYFSPSEIVDMIQHVDRSESSFLFEIVTHKSEDLVMLTWKEICESLIAINEYYEKNLKENSIWPFASLLIYIKLPCILLKHQNNLENFLNEFFKKFKLIDSYTIIESMLDDYTALDDYNIPLRIAPCDKIDFHEAFWEIIIHAKKNIREIFDRRDLNGNNFLHIVVLNGHFDIIKFTIQDIMKNNLRSAQCIQILHAKGAKDRNFLQIAVCQLKDLKIIQYLWRIIRSSCKTDDGFLKILNEVDNDGNSVFHLASTLASSDVFEFIIAELEQVAPPKILTEILTKLGFKNRNLLHALAYNESLDTHKKVWEIIDSKLDDEIILNLINNVDSNGNNVFHNAILLNTKEIVDFTWIKIKLFLRKNEEISNFLTTKGQKQNTLLELGLENRHKNPYVYNWIMILLHKHGISYLINNNKVIETFSHFRKASKLNFNDIYLKD